MAALTQTRALNPRAFTVTYGKPTRKSAKVSNGSRVFMKRKDSYMVEVELADDESEDSAVKRYMKAVVQSGVLEQLRARRRKETKIEEHKRKLQARAQARRLGIVEPTWEECYGLDDESRPFEEYFRYGDDGEYDSLPFSQGPMFQLDQGMYPYDANFNAATGGYIDQAGYVDPSYPQQGGYIQGGFAQQGGYADPNAGQGGYVDAGVMQQQQQQVQQAYMPTQELPEQTFNFNEPAPQQQ